MNVHSLSFFGISIQRWFICWRFQEWRQWRFQKCLKDYHQCGSQKVVSYSNTCNVMLSHIAMPKRYKFQSELSQKCLRIVFPISWVFLTCLPTLTKNDYKKLSLSTGLPLFRSKMPQMRHEGGSQCCSQGGWEWSHEAAAWRFMANMAFSKRDSPRSEVFAWRLRWPSPFDMPYGSKWHLARLEPLEPSNTDFLLSSPSAN